MTSPPGSPEVVERLTRIETLLEIIHREVRVSTETQRDHGTRLTILEAVQSSQADQTDKSLAKSALWLSLGAVAAAFGGWLWPT